MNATIRHILVPVDFTALSIRVGAFARTVGGSLNAEVHLLHILEEPFTSAAPYEFHLPDTPARRERLYTQARERLSTIAEELRANDVEATTEVRIGSATEEIVKAAIDYGADLIVMGTQGRRGLQHLLTGSVAEDVIRRARCPVLMVRGHGGASAATAAA